MKQHYPKMVYRGGVEDYRIVADEAALEAAKADGYGPLGQAEPDEPPKRRGRPPKAG